MVTIKNGRGLCMTCNNAPTCFYRASRGPGLVCELFDGYAEPPVRRFEGGVFSSASVFAVEEDSPAYPGICMNCDDRRSCRNPRPASGVWHCEDYR